jgi:hypothetical protein
LLVESQIDFLKSAKSTRMPVEVDCGAVAVEKIFSVDLNSYRSRSHGVSLCLPTDKTKLPYLEGNLFPSSGNCVQPDGRVSLSRNEDDRPRRVMVEKWAVPKQKQAQAAFWGTPDLQSGYTRIKVPLGLDLSTGMGNRLAGPGLCQNEIGPEIAVIAWSWGKPRPRASVLWAPINR